MENIWLLSQSAAERLVVGHHHELVGHRGELRGALPEVQPELQVSAMDPGPGAGGIRGSGPRPRKVSRQLSAPLQCNWQEQQL